MPPNSKGALSPTKPTIAPQGRASRRAARTQELLDAAMAIVVEQGVDALTVAGVAQRVGGAVGAMYRYYPGKGALIVALQQSAILHFKCQLDERLSRLADRSALARLLGVSDAWVSWAEAHPRLHELIDIMTSDPRNVLTDDESAQVDTVLGPVLHTVSAILAQAVAAAELAAGDPVQRTYALWAFLHGVDHFKKRDRRVEASLRSTGIRDLGIGTLLAGWGASDAAIRGAFDART